jgi:hypothetical protein
MRKGATKRPVTGDEAMESATENSYLSWCCNIHIIPSTTKVGVPNTHRP